MLFVLHALKEWKRDGNNNNNDGNDDTVTPSCVRHDEWLTCFSYSMRYFTELSEQRWWIVYACALKALVSLQHRHKCSKWICIDGYSWNIHTIFFFACVFRSRKCILRYIKFVVPAFGFFNIPILTFIVCEESLKGYLSHLCYPIELMERRLIVRNNNFYLIFFLLPLSIEQRSPSVKVRWATQIS